MAWVFWLFMVMMGTVIGFVIKKVFSLRGEV